MQMLAAQMHYSWPVDLQHFLDSAMEAGTRVQQHNATERVKSHSHPSSKNHIMLSSTHVRPSQ
jgi:hypothetical protein